MDTTYKTVGQPRSRTVYISHENDWMLRALVKGVSKYLESGTSKDEVVDSLLAEHFRTYHPDLVALYKERQQIDNKAVEAAKGHEPKRH